MPISAGFHAVGLHREGPHPLRPVARALAWSPWVWGGVMTWGFHALLLPRMPVYRELLSRYLRGHEVAFMELGLFFVGIAALAIKLLRLGHEKNAASQALPPASLGIPLWCETLRRALRTWPEELSFTWLRRRVEGIADYLTQGQTTAGLDAHARRLAAQDAEAHRDSFSLLQTVNWGIPVLGGLGTLMGVGVSLAKLSTGQPMSAMTGQLAVSFDTTVLALALTLPLAFASLFLRRAEQQVLAGVDARVFKEIVCRLADAPPGSPLLDAETRAAQDLLKRTGDLIDQQTDLWRNSIETLRHRWSQTLDTQRQELSSALAGGLQQTLTSHAGELAGLREEFAAAWKSIAAEATRQLAAAQARQAEHQAGLQTALSETWQRMRADLVEERAARTAEADRILSELSRNVRYISQRLQEAAAASGDQMAALARQTDLLGQVVSREEDLAGLQTRLTENLEAIREAGSFQETLHSLNAAVHLLTARARPKAAA